MPELPEVETVRRQLLRVWKGRRIESAQVGPPSYFFVTPPSRLKRKLVGQTLLDIKRYGKTLVAHFEDGDRFLFHLGMTGQFVASALAQDGHVHLILHLTGNKTLSFRDVRKFGKVEWIDKTKNSPRLDRLGPDALAISSEDLQTALRGRKTSIKAALLNQKLLSGVGNIYADEALFASKIHPERVAGGLTKKETNILAEAVRRILEQAIASGGSTISDYVQTNGKSGNYQNHHQVYGRASAISAPNVSSECREPTK
jgi:formamidopyrimidine-DNA glycosylase